MAFAVRETLNFPLKFSKNALCCGIVYGRNGEEDEKEQRDTVDPEECQTDRKTEGIERHLNNEKKRKYKKITAHLCPRLK